MVDSYTATIVIIGFLTIFGVILPILDRIPKIKSIVSFRWSIVVVYSALCVGVILDFSHLDNSVRFAVVLGGLILSALFLLVRSIEKILFSNCKLPDHIRTKISKGDINAELSVAPTIEKNTRSNKRDKEEDLSDLLDSSLNSQLKDSSFFQTIKKHRDKHDKENKQ